MSSLVSNKWPIKAQEQLPLLGAGRPPQERLYLLSFRTEVTLYRCRNPVLHSEAKMNSISSSWI